MENIRISCPQSEIKSFLLCTVNFAVKCLFLSGFCMIYCIDLREGNVRNKCRICDTVEVNFLYPLCLFRKLHSEFRSVIPIHGFCF